MYKKKVDISIIIPFYYGNQYMERLLSSIQKCNKKNENKIEIEIVIVNDSPEETVYIPEKFRNLNIKIIYNEHNMGIQKTRIKGVKNAKNTWIIFLDQDDELLSEGFSQQIELTEKAEVIVGNGFYQFGEENRKIFTNYKEMKYLIRLNNFIKIRNLIPSPGECIIKKSIIPEQWLELPLKKNGADDWLLWILLFKEGARFVCNSEMVYVHNDTNGANLSADLKKMKESAIEMYNILVKKNILTVKEQKNLRNAIWFKYLQDTKKLTKIDIIRYWMTILENIKYKVIRNILKICNTKN